MGFAIELFFDKATESRIRCLWDEFAGFGAISMSKGDSRPHVSLAVAESVDLPATRHLLEGFAREITPFPISFAAMGFFPNSDSLISYLAPKVTPELLALHERFLGQFAPIASGVWAPYMPAAWVPHCTLAMNLLPQQLAPAFDAVRSFGLPMGGTVIEIGLIEFRPVKQLFTAPFSR